MVASYTVVRLILSKIMYRHKTSQKELLYFVEASHSTSSRPFAQKTLGETVFSFYAMPLSTCTHAVWDM